MQERLPKPLHYGLLASIYLVGIITLFSHTVLHALQPDEVSHVHQSSQSLAQSACADDSKTIPVSVSNSGFNPKQITASRCDVLAITNTGNTEYELAIGEHVHHIAYPGFAEAELKPGESMSIDLVQAGTYVLHDHLQDKIEAELIVR